MPIELHSLPHFDPRVNFPCRVGLIARSTIGYQFDDTISSQNGAVPSLWYYYPSSISLSPSEVSLHDEKTARWLPSACCCVGRYGFLQQSAGWFGDQWFDGNTRCGDTAALWYGPIPEAVGGTGNQLPSKRACSSPGVFCTSHTFQEP